jgi:hypothetical protein
MDCLVYLLDLPFVGTQEDVRIQVVDPVSILLDVQGAFAYTPPSVCPVRLAFATDRENKK